MKIELVCILVSALALVSAIPLEESENHTRSIDPSLVVCDRSLDPLHARCGGGDTGVSDEDEDENEGDEGSDNNNSNTSGSPQDTSPSSSGPGINNPSLNAGLAPSDLQTVVITGTTIDVSSIIGLTIPQFETRFDMPFVAIKGKSISKGLKRLDFIIDVYNAGVEIKDAVVALYHKVFPEPPPTSTVTAPKPTNPSCPHCPLP